MDEWVPIFFVTFKVLVFGTCMFFAIKWHYDQEKKEKEMEMREVLLAGVKAAAVFVLLLLILGLFAFFLCKKLDLDVFP